MAKAKTTTETTKETATKKAAKKAPPARAAAKSGEAKASPKSSKTTARKSATTKEPKAATKPKAPAKAKTKATVAAKAENPKAGTRKTTTAKAATTAKAPAKRVAKAKANTAEPAPAVVQPATAKSVVKAKPAPASQARMRELESENRELPNDYDDTKVVLLSRDPEKIFVYWEVGRAVRKRLGIERNKHNRPLILRVSESLIGQSGFENRYDIEISDYTSQHYLTIKDRVRAIRVALGVYDVKGTFKEIAVSGETTVPKLGIAEETDVEFATIDDEVYNQIVELSGGAAIGERLGSDEFLRTLQQRVISTIYDGPFSSGSLSSSGMFSGIFAGASSYLMPSSFQSTMQMGEGGEDSLKSPRTEQREFWLEVGVDELARRAERIGRHGSWLERWREQRAARLGLIDLPLPVRFDRRVAAQVLADIKEAQDRPGVDARFKLQGLGIVDPTHPLPSSIEVEPDRPGVYLDVDRSIESLLVALRRGERRSSLVDVRISPQLSSRALSEIRAERVVAEYTSRFSRGGDADNRATNIETAASRLDGVVLPPGELVSFNALVGARTLDNGFRPGWEIFRGEMVRGVGGGTCQVSSTLHAAAVYGGLDIVERAPHSRPSAYMPLGLDSTVAWPSVDLKIKNPWDEPLVVHTVVKGNELRVQLLGEDKPASVRWHTETLAILPFKRKITESGWLSEGTVIKKQKGIRGYRLRRVRELTLADGSTRVEETVDVYPPTDEHFIVPRGAELAEVLPPPAEGSVEAREQAESEQAGVVIATQQPFEP